MNKRIIGIEGIKLIKKFEGCKLKAYLCPAKVWTIGYGNTFLEDGTPVKKDDVIDQETANILFLNIVKLFYVSVDKMVTSNVSQNQFDAMVSLSYNIGLGNFKKSSVLKKANINPDDKTIEVSFNSWNKGGGKILKGLVNRRADEVKLYFK